MKNKFIVFFVIFLLLLSFCNSCYCSDYDFTYICPIDNKEYNVIISDAYKNFNYCCLFSNFKSGSYPTVFIELIASDYEFFFDDIQRKVFFSDFDCSHSFVKYSFSSFTPFSTTDVDNCFNIISNKSSDKLVYKTPADYGYTNNTIYAGSISWGAWATDYGDGAFSCLYSNFNLKNSSGDIIHEYVPPFQNPYFITTSEELASGRFTLKISGGDLSYTPSTKFYLHIDEGYDIGDVTYNYIRKKSYCLDQTSSYWNGDGVVDYYYFPSNKLGIDLSTGKQYSFILSYGDDIYDQVIFQVGQLTAEEEEQNEKDYDTQLKEEQNSELKEQTKQLEEQNKTNKNIFEKIGDIFDLLNPFSENFFAYKLVEMFLNMLKSLFIPSDEFFNTYFNNLKDWFSDRLGFLFYPFELLINILNSISNINFSEPVFNIPNINEPFSGKTLISEQQFNFNSLLSNNIFNTVHNIYLVCVDAFIVFNLVNLFRNKYEEVTKK